MNKSRKTKLLSTGAIFGAIVISVGTLAMSKKLRNNKLRKRLVHEKYFTGKIRKFGTLYLDDKKQKKPVDFLGFEDIPEYMGQKIEIRDTDKNDKNKLSWIEINNNDKKLLICDRNILKQISWDELNEQGLIFGKVVLIDCKKYILRLLTGDDENKDYTLNEWDRYIVNIENIIDLPICADYDKDNNSKEEESVEKLNGDNNNLWNWYKFSSITQNECLRNQKCIIVRGFYSAIYSNQSDKDLKYETVGYRPVLELIE